MTSIRATSARRLSCVFLLLLFALVPEGGWAAVGGSISGTIKDPSGGVIPGVMLRVTNTAIGTEFKTVSDGQGLYSFPNLPVGRYDLVIEADGFNAQKKTGLVIDSDSAIQINTTLELHALTESVSVTTTEAFEEVHVETVATQLGEVVSEKKMTTLSLNGRSYTDLLPIQPGVAPITTIKPNSVIMAGVTGAIAPSGELNPGNMSISGQRAAGIGEWFHGEWERCAGAHEWRHIRGSQPGLHRGVSRPDQ